MKTALFSIILSILMNNVFCAGSNPQGTFTLKSDMPGRIIHVSCKIGQFINKGEELFALEAMKMETSVHARFSGIVKTIDIAPGKCWPSAVITINI